MKEITPLRYGSSAPPRQLRKRSREAKLAADKERRQAQHERAAQAERIWQEKLAAGEALPSKMKKSLSRSGAKLANLDAFVGTPIPGNEIAAAVPVVAPWSALGKCKYKTKLQPGSVEKGKAVREIVTRWVKAGKLRPKVADGSAQDRERVWAREIECIRVWRVGGDRAVTCEKGESGARGRAWWWERECWGKRRWQRERDEWEW